MLGFRKRLAILTSPARPAPATARPDRPPVRRSRRQARVALCWLFGLMLATHVPFWAWMEFAFPEARDPEYGRRLRSLRSVVAERPGRPLVLVLGSSRVVMGLRPDALPDGPTDPIVFNAGRVGAGPLMQEVLLRRYLADGARPNAVIVEVWPQLFNGNELDRIEAGRLRLTDVARLNDRPHGQLRLWADGLAGTLAPWADYRGNLMRRALPGWVGPGDRVQSQAKGWTWLTLDRWGWLPLHHPEFERVPRADIIERMHNFYEPVLRDLVPDAQSEADYRSLLALCRSHGIPAALVYLPESSEFRAFYGESAWQRFQALVARLQAEFGIGLADGRLVVGDADLPDGHHLSTAGAATFTRWFGRTLPSILPPVRRLPAE